MSAQKIVDQIKENMKQIIIGKDQVIEQVLVCLLAKGHLLIEDVPGTGKTTLVKALAKSLGLSFSRIQFTPDLTPSDIIGVTQYSRKEEAFFFRQGPIFHQLVLADEINRTSPKTQSSLLQVMEEGEISVENTTYTLQQPFMVLATQNPVEYQGTFPLPEAQLDRFMMCISLGYPDAQAEEEILRRGRGSERIEALQPVTNGETLMKMQGEVESVFVHGELRSYIVNLVQRTRTYPGIYLGASPRGSIDLFRGAKALAYIRGRDYVTPDDIKEVAPAILCHRMLLAPEARIEGRRMNQLMEEILKRTYIPGVSGRAD